MERGFVDRESFRLHYTIEGQGPTVLVVGSSLYYPRTFSQKLRQKCRFVFMDHRGFAQALAPYEKEDFELERLLEDIEAVRLHLHLETVIILGHSGHGYMALEYAKRYPKSVSHVVLIAVGPSQSLENHQLAHQYLASTVDDKRQLILAQDMAELEQTLSKNPKNRFIQFCLALRAKSWLNPEFNAKPLWEGVYTQDLMFDYVWGEVFRDIDIKQGLDKLQLPIFLALGLHDYLVAPFYTWQPLLSDFPCFTLRLFAQSSHTPQLEESDKFDQAFVNWLNMTRSL
jgi:proline iminopeptidase